jgi:LmbE family N-acetylglucosaminyl deacetylase
MGTLVSFHAHPDDESIATAGTMVKAKALGHRVVLVVATRGERGEPVPGVLADGEPLSVRRTAETYESARVLGVDRVEFLGYIDSGMKGTPTSEEPWSFAQTPIEHAAARLALVLREEDADVLTTYDDNGAYGHPDHIQVHRVGARAAELVGLDQVYQQTINRTLLLEGASAMAGSLPEGAEVPDFASQPDFGKPAEVITHRVEVAEHAPLKRESMRAHRSQISDDDFFLTLPDEVFGRAFGVEWYISDAAAPPAGSLASQLFEPTR